MEKSSSEEGMEVPENYQGAARQQCSFLSPYVLCPTGVDGAAQSRTVESLARINPPVMADRTVPLPF